MCTGGSPRLDRPLCGQHCRRARHPTERKMPAHWSVKPRCGPRRRCTVRACGTSEPSGGSSSALRFDMAPEQRRGRESRRRAGQPGGARQGALLPSRLTAGVAEEEEGSPGRWLQKGGHRRQSTLWCELAGIETLSFFLLWLDLHSNCLEQKVVRAISRLHQRLCQMFATECPQ